MYRPSCPHTCTMLPCIVLPLNDTSSVSCMHAPTSIHIHAGPTNCAIFSSTDCISEVLSALLHQRLPHTRTSAFTIMSTHPYNAAMCVVMMSCMHAPTSLQIHAGPLHQACDTLKHRLHPNNAAQAVEWTITSTHLLMLPCLTVIACLLVSRMRPQIHAGPITKRGDIDFESIVKLADDFNGADLRNVSS